MRGLSNATALTTCHTTSSDATICSLAFAGALCGCAPLSRRFHLLLEVPFPPPPGSLAAAVCPVMEASAAYLCGQALPAVVVPVCGTADRDWGDASTRISIRTFRCCTNGGEPSPAAFHTTTVTAAHGPAGKGKETVPHSIA